jgi:hypothetical protein
LRFLVGNKPFEMRSCRICILQHLDIGPRIDKMRTCSPGLTGRYPGLFMEKRADAITLDVLGRDGEDDAEADWL